MESPESRLSGYGDADKFERPLQFADDFNGPKLNPFWGVSGPEQEYEFVNEPSTDVQSLRISVKPGDGKEGRVWTREAADRRADMVASRDPEAGQYIPHGAEVQGTHLRGKADWLTERFEIKEMPENFVKPGIEAWYGVSILVPVDFVIGKNRLVIAQWREEGHHELSPAMAFRYIDGKLLFTVSSIDTMNVSLNKTQFEGPELEKGAWHRIMLQYKLGRAKPVDVKTRMQAAIECNAFVDGAKFAIYKGPISMMSDGGRGAAPQLRFRMGLYRNQVPRTDTLYFSKFRRGDSKEFCEK